MNQNCCKMGGCVPYMISKVLVVVGGLNWGLVGLGMLLQGGSGWNLVNMLFGSLPLVEAIVYVLVGIGAVVLAFGCRCGKCMTCTTCNDKDGAGQVPPQGANM